MKVLTVAVPSYNSQDYLENCVQSLLKGGERMDIVIIDDGSKDKTGEIADRLAKANPEIVRVIHQENGGHGAGINQGLKNALGTYFKVVDSDDTLSEDLPNLLDELEKLEARGGVDLFVTNYYYVHSDGIGDRAIRYGNALPEGEIFTWQQTHRFRPHQLLTLHSCTFRTETMRRDWKDLPLHTFYEDNLMVYQVLPKVQRLYYRDWNLYRYWIGRPDQSVQRDVMTRRYNHQLLVCKSCFQTVHLDDVTDRALRRYLKHELFLMFGIGVMYARLNQSPQANRDLHEMWLECDAFDSKWGRYFRRYTPLVLLRIPGKMGSYLDSSVYFVANHVVRFNQ